MSGVVLVPEEYGSEHLGALLEIADLDRQVGYLEGEIQRARLREWAMGISAVAGWVLVTVTNWRFLCRLGEAFAGLAGRITGGLFS